MQKGAAGVSRTAMPRGMSSEANGVCGGTATKGPTVVSPSSDATRL